MLDQILHRVWMEHVSLSLPQPINHRYHADVARRLRLGAMVARHLMLFIGGKLEVAGLGEFCCASRPLRHHDVSVRANETV